jgi:hypothetical protein
MNAPKGHIGTDELAELAELRKRAKLVCETTQRLIDDFHKIRAQRAARLKPTLAH